MSTTTRLSIFVVGSLCSLLAVASTVSAASEDLAVRQALERYLHGTSTNDGPLTASAFYEDARLFLSHPERELWIVPIAEYADRMPSQDRGRPNGRTGQVLSIHRHGDIATASAEIIVPDMNARFMDLFLLKKLGGEWKILSKAATRAEQS